MHASYYSDGRHEADPVQRRQGAAMLAYRRSDPPGSWTDNRLLQSQKFTGVTYVAIQSILDLVGGCTYQVVRRKRKVVKATFLPGGRVVKAMPTAHAQADDEEYTPFRDRDHPLGAVVARPNAHQTFGELCGDIVLQNRLTGVGPLWTVPNRAGKPVELWALKTALTYPIYQLSTMYPKGAWRVNPYGAAAGWMGMMPGGLSATGGIIPGEEVARFRERHPLIDWDGFSPLTADARQLDILEAIDESRWSAMNDGLQLDAVLTVPGADQGELDRLSTKMREKAGGSKNARKFLTLATPPGTNPADRPTLNVFGTSPRDMDYSQGWEQMTKFCLAVFGVPASVAGLQEKTSYAELYASLRQFHHRQGQFIRRLAEWLTKVLCWPWCEHPDEFKLQIDLPGLDDPDMLERQLGADTGIRTVNERRALRNLDPVEGGDVPEQIWLKWVEQKYLTPPEPEQPPAGEQQPDQSPPADNPLAALAGETPTGGAPPGPEAGAGQLPPRDAVAKAMGELAGSAGGFLVPPAAAVKKKRRKKLRGCIRKALAELED